VVWDSFAISIQPSHWKISPLRKYQSAALAARLRIVSKFSAESQAEVVFEPLNL